MVIKIYISGSSGNKEVKKRQQRVLLILDSKNVKYEVIDIAEPGAEEAKDFMQNNSTSLGATIGDPSPRHALPPQIFNDDAYCGDYDMFDMANEIDEMENFLKLEPNSLNEQTSTAEIKLKNGDLSIDEKIDKVAGATIEDEQTNEIKVSAEQEQEKKVESDDKDEREKSVEKEKSVEREKSEEKKKSVEREKSVEKEKSVEREKSIEKEASGEKEKSVEKEKSAEREKSIEKEKSVEKEDLKPESEEKEVVSQEKDDADEDVEEESGAGDNKENENEENEKSEKEASPEKSE